MEFQNLITLIKSVSASDLTELKYEENGVKIKLSKKERKVQTIQVSEALTSEAAALTAGRNEKESQSTGKGQTLAIVEAMKLMNEIESDYDGTVAEVLAENGAPVEYGQPLFRII